MRVYLVLFVTGVRHGAYRERIIVTTELFLSFAALSVTWSFSCFPLTTRRICSVWIPSDSHIFCFNLYICKHDKYEVYVRETRQEIRMGETRATLFLRTRAGTYRIRCSALDEFVLSRDFLHKLRKHFKIRECIAAFFYTSIANEDIFCLNFYSGSNISYPRSDDTTWCGLPRTFTLILSVSTASIFSVFVFKNICILK